MALITSSVRSLRPAKGTPRASNSGSRYPAPRPTIIRPPLSTSRVAMPLAARKGFRYGATKRFVCRRSPVVAAAAKARVTNGSRA